jgi:hypothetical protein
MKTFITLHTNSNGQSAKQRLKNHEVATMQISHFTSRWESTPTRENPRFPRNVHRARRPPKLVRRVSSKSRRSSAEASFLQLQNELNDRFDLQELNPTPRRMSMLGGLVGSRIRYNSRGQPIIIVRRSTATTACSEITLEFDSGLFSMDDDDDDDDDDMFDDDVSELASLVDDETVDESLATHRPSKAKSQSVPAMEAGEEDCTKGILVPRILILGLEPRTGSAHLHPSREVTEEVGKLFKASNDNAVEVYAAVIRTDSQIDDDSRNDHFILTMTSIRKTFQRAQHPDAIFVITTDSDTSDIALEGYHSDQTSANTKVFNLLEFLRSHEIPVCAKPVFGVEVCREWSDRLENAGAFSGRQLPPIVFFHLPPLTPDTAVFHHQPYLKAETSVKAISVAVKRVASRLTAKK